MSEGSSSEMPRSTEAATNSYQSTEQRKPEPTPTIVLQPITSLDSRSRMRAKPKLGIMGKVRSAVAGAGIGVMTLVGANQAGVDLEGGVNNFVDSFRFSQYAQNTEPSPTPTLESDKSFPEAINRETVKIQRGDTIINRYDVVNRDEIRLRRDATTAVSLGNDPTPEDNRVDWDDLKSVNGEELGAAKVFKIMDAPVVEGQPVDEAGQGYYWIKIENVELKSGEKTTLYVSRSRKTQNIVQTSGLPQDLNRGADGKINEPNMGRVTVIQPSPVR